MRISYNNVLAIYFRNNILTADAAISTFYSSKLSEITGKKLFMSVVEVITFKCQSRVLTNYMETTITFSHIFQHFQG